MVNLTIGTKPLFVFQFLYIFYGAGTRLIIGLIYYICLLYETYKAMKQFSIITTDDKNYIKTSRHVYTIFPCNTTIGKTNS